EFLRIRGSDAALRSIPVVVCSCVSDQSTAGEVVGGQGGEGKPVDPARLIALARPYCLGGAGWPGAAFCVLARQGEGPRRSASRPCPTGPAAARRGWQGCTRALWDAGGRPISAPPPGGRIGKEAGAARLRGTFLAGAPPPCPDCSPAAAISSRR